MIGQGPAAAPRAWALWGLMALNLGVWLGGLAAGFHATQPAAADLFRWGANSAWAVLRDQQAWRLLTGTFLHAGVLHLALNMLGLWSAGRMLHPLVGPGRFLLLYFGAALVGSVASLHFSSRTAVGVGASGAVFGILGALLVVVRRNRAHLPAGTWRQVLVAQGFFLVYALVQGFGSKGIDNAAHVGGLVAGAGMAWLLGDRLLDRASTAARGRWIFAVLGCVLLAAALLATAPAPLVDHRRTIAAQDRLGVVVPQLQAAERALQRDARAHRDGQLSQEDLLAALERTHLPAYRALEAELARVELPAADARTEWLADVQRLVRGMTALLDLQVRRARGDGGPEAEARLAALGQEMARVRSRLAARREALQAPP